MSEQEHKFSTIETKAVHAGEHTKYYDGAVTAPIFQTSTYLYGGATDYNDLKYLRLNNSPTHDLLHRKLAALENAESALVTSSGMSAITTTLLTIFESPGHLLAQNCLYGGTHHFLSHDFSKMGHQVSFLDMNKPETWTSALTSQTKAFYVETITNPLLEVVDLKAVVEFCRGHGLISIIDNTIASPVNFNPIPFGFDVAVHSCTKYLNGHSDLVAGCVVGGAGQIKQITRKLNHLGGCLDAHACFLLNRGIKTLALRVREQNSNALALARFLREHPRVERAIYPGLENHRDHARARELLRGFGGVVCFEFKGTAGEADQFLSRLRIPQVAPSLGGVECLITRPAITSHIGMSESERHRIGIRDQLIRVSVGIENQNEIIADFNQAFE